MSSVTRLRKSHEELVDAIMEALPVRADATVESIARIVGSSWETTDRWVRLMTYIQGLPRILSNKSPLGRGLVYRRERVRRGEKT